MLRIALILALVCSFALAQSEKLFAPQGPTSGKLSDWPIIPVDASSPAGERQSIIPVKRINPDEVMPFVEVEDGQYFTLLRYRIAGESPVRLHFTSFRLPDAARVFVYSVDGTAQTTRIEADFTGTDCQQSTFTGRVVLTKD